MIDRTDLDLRVDAHERRTNAADSRAWLSARSRCRSHRRNIRAAGLAAYAIAVALLFGVHVISTQGGGVRPTTIVSAGTETWEEQSMWVCFRDLLNIIDNHTDIDSPDDEAFIGPALLDCGGCGGGLPLDPSWECAVRPNLIA